MVAAPALAPVTIPVALTPAIAALLLLHTPPGVISDKLIVSPAQTFVNPLIAAGDGLTTTLTDVVHPAGEV